MRLTELLFSFKGRIQRLYWWVATIAVGAAAGAITGILEVAAKSSGHSVVNPDTQQFEATGLFGIVVLLVGLVNLWINFALSVKRLHDRGRTGWWLVGQTLILAVAAVLVVVAIAVPKEQAPVWWVLASVVGIVALAVSIWLFVEIGFLRGTQGPNRFGEDPLGATSAGATIDRNDPAAGAGSLPVERQSLRQYSVRVPRTHHAPPLVVGDHRHRRRGDCRRVGDPSSRGLGEHRTHQDARR